jgi:hypothetical protein
MKLFLIVWMIGILPMTLIFLNINAYAAGDDSKDMGKDLVIGLIWPLSLVLLLYAVVHMYVLPHVCRAVTWPGRTLRRRWRP